VSAEATARSEVRDPGAAEAVVSAARDVGADVLTVSSEARSEGAVGPTAVSEERNEGAAAVGAGEPRGESWSCIFSILPR
jgi:hypothetical protein